MSLFRFTRRAALAGFAASAFGRTLKSPGVQLYTVRSTIEQDPRQVLGQIAAIGYREVEVTWANLDKVYPAIREAGLKPVSLHLDTPMFMREPDKLPAAVEKAAARGFAYVVCPYVRPEDRGGEDVMKRMADALNKAGGLARKSGLTLCYHNHAFEFARAGNRTLLDVLLESSDPALVQLEMDVMWVTVAGADPAALLAKYRNRTPLMHLKDLHKGVANRLDEKVERTAFAEVGAGRVDFPAVLAAAAKAGTKHFFVEQDQTPGNPVDSLRTSWTNIRKIRF